MTIVTRPSAVKQISSHSGKTKSQRPQRPPRQPHGHPRHSVYRPPSRPRPARYALDMGRNISLLLTLEKNRIAPNAATLAKIGGAE